MKLNNLIKNQQFIFMAMVLLGGFFSLWVVGDLSTPILTSIVLALLFRPMQVYFTKIGIPETKLLVPSMGSITHFPLLPESWKPCSSPRISCEGYFSLIISRIRVSARRSATVTGLLSGLSSKSKSARKYFWIKNRGWVREKKNIWVFGREISFFLV